MKETFRKINCSSPTSLWNDEEENNFVREQSACTCCSIYHLLITCMGDSFTTVGSAANIKLAPLHLA